MQPPGSALGAGQLRHHRLALIEGDLCVDTTQRYSLGFSFGGAMSYSLACSRADVFRAVAAYGSPGLISGCAGGSDPIAVFAAHGTTDQFSDGIAQRDRFAANNGCAPQNTPEPPQGSLTHITTAFSGCSEGHPVVWASFDGGHTPAPRDGAPGSGPDTWLPAETWAFFTQFQSGPPTTNPPATTAPPPAGECTTAYRIVNQWQGGFQGEVTVTNTSTATSGGWVVTWTFADGQRITQLWNGTNSQVGAVVTVGNEAWNGSLGPGGSTGFGFLASWNGASNSVPSNIACTLR